MNTAASSLRRKFDKFVWNEALKFQKLRTDPHMMESLMLGSIRNVSKVHDPQGCSDGTIYCCLVAFALTMTTIEVSLAVESR